MIQDKMNWISFSEKKPPIGQSLITRAPAWKRGENFFDLWRQWGGEESTFRPHPISHWWDGKIDLELAKEKWHE